MKKNLLRFVFFLFLVGCATDQSIVNNVDERQANEIVVFLASKGIRALKVMAPSGATAGPSSSSDLFNISVEEGKATQAMALLNRYGLPRRHGTDLLKLFAKSGLVSSDREETIRYQAGLAEELQNTVLKMDGVLDADVQISFPPSETAITPGAQPPKITAAVYVKHQGVMEDPNNHMEVKIKRLLAGSVNGLKFEDVSVISDRAILADVSVGGEGELIGRKALEQTYAKIWGITLTKGSLIRFRAIFFSFIFALLFFVGALGYLVYRFYPMMRKKPAAEETPPPAEETPPTAET